MCQIIHQEMTRWEQFSILPSPDFDSRAMSSGLLDHPVQSYDEFQKTLRGVERDYRHYLNKAARQFAERRTWPADLAPLDYYFLFHRLFFASRMLDVFGEPHSRTGQPMVAMHLPTERSLADVLEWFLVDVWLEAGLPFWEYGSYAEFQEFTEGKERLAEPALN